ncbi:hypothetical protein CIRG_03175 [Coccidioides immitis RMSCC 2394]|uniref:Mesaconyl-C4 CoA hydratase n=1 Tax=Coccidioides immitis RMSCC 2394 TaxID=404692 RepID=A0A0J6Y9L8_COCIT|nr:hypothetical protein CIRG_03175 [Coccidioides immitis RMSCC 2394]
MTTPKSEDKTMSQIVRRNGPAWLNGLPSHNSRKYATSPLLSRLEETLIGQRLFLSYDYLSPQPSHLLRVSLADFLPFSQSNPFAKDVKKLALPSILEPGHMPRGHHLVYFPPQLPSSQLVPDGCDVLHSPGAPFNRRMWAGGSVRFRDLNGGPLLNCQRAVCVEGVRDVRVTGKEGEEKVFVGIERRVAILGEKEKEEDITSRIWTENEEDWGDSTVIEKRNLVFMRDKIPEQLRAEKTDGNQQTKILRAPANPTFRHTLTPSRALLFRFSALTFNAHSIHLDRDYARNTEGYEDLLVHGPLTLTLMLTLLQDHLSESRQAISAIEYRNLAPILVEQPLTVCAKPKEPACRSLWDVWIERNDGGLAVKGTIQTKPFGKHDENPAATISRL